MNKEKTDAVTDVGARAWVRLPSGRHLDLINPAPDAWTDSDFASRLSRTYRWGGESAWPLPLSVAQHSLTVLALRRAWSGTPLSAADAMHELMHDGEEAFLGFDCIAPLKTVLGQAFRDVSERLMSAIRLRYGLPQWSPETYSAHKRADSTAAASEAVHCVGWSPQEVRTVLRIVHPILDSDPLTSVYDCAPWEPWPSDLAAERFLEQLTELSRAAPLPGHKV